MVEEVRTGKQDGNIILALSYYLIYATLHVMSMILIMTYNGGVILTMVGFMAVAYFFFGSQDKDADNPINCCAGNV